MKYTTEIVIRLPRAKVIELLLDPKNFKHWQPGLKSSEHLEGMQAEEGARSKLVYAGRKSDLVITETITANRLPEQIDMEYKSHGVFNSVENHFTEPEPELTLWRTENHFRFGGVMMLMVPFMKQAFIHNTMLNMDRFKLYAENINQ